MSTHNERGIAIVLALFLMSAMSVLAASLMFLSQTETYASMNYRMMSQARYAGEAAVQKAANFLLDSAQYTIPGSVSDPLANYNTSVSPVTYNGNPVILSATASQSSNYPVAAVRTAFAAAAQGTLMAGNATLNYSAYATLLHMQQFDSYGGGQRVVQTWQITGDGAVAGTRSATVQVVATMETPKVAANSYAAFATDDSCGAIHFNGNVVIDSYDSSVGPPGTCPTCSTEEEGGDIGTNGNVEIEGSVEVQGNLYTPRTGVGDCSSGAVSALSETGNAEVTGSIVQLPTAVEYPVPTFSPLPPTNTVTINAALLAVPVNACFSLGLTWGVNCSVNAVTKTVTVDGNGTDVTLPSVDIANGFTLVLNGNNPANNINLNSLTGSGAVEVAANMAGANNESVVLRVAGLNADGSEMATPFDLSTMSWKQNSPASSYDASALQIVYGGSATINMQGGNSQSAATIYAPNAEFILQGTQDLYGSILARTIRNVGSGSIHYDRRLARDFWVAGHPMVGTFTWNRY
jgi:hypothetical protein